MSVSNQESTAKKRFQIQMKELLSQLDKEDKNIPSNPNEEFQENSSDSPFTELYNKSIAGQKFKAGSVVKGKIVSVDDDYVVVDVNYKSEGLIPKSEFQGINGLQGADVGADIEVYIDNIENENGMMSLSKDRADIIRVWKDISQVAKSQKIIQGTVISKVKGGLHVDIGGVKAFLPGSQVELRAVKNLNNYVGKSYSFKIIKFNQKRGNIVLSRRVVLQEERDHLRNQTLGGIEKGAVVSGIVKNITDYGAFLDLGGIDGLLHIADISWNRIKHPSEKLSVGQTLKVKILKFDKEKNRVSLGLKQLNESENPWEKVKSTIKEGDQVKGRVTSLTDYGAFVAIKEGVEGLVHISEMSWGKKVKKPSDILSPGAEVDLKVIGVDHDHQRISFSIKRMTESPWEKWIQKYPKGAKVETHVHAVTDFGLFVRLEDDIEGLIRMSDLSWNRAGAKPKYNVGDAVSAVILNFNEDEEKFQLGVKQLSDNPWSNIDSLYPIGSVHQVKVIKIVDFGAFVELGSQGVEGLIHISEMSKNRVAKVEDIVKIGDVVSAEIITMDKELQKIGLSLKMAEIRKESQHPEEKKDDPAAASAGASAGADSKEEKPSPAKEPAEKKESFFAKALKASISRGKEQKKNTEEDKP